MSSPVWTDDAKGIFKSVPVSGKSSLGSLTAPLEAVYVNNLVVLESETSIGDQTVDGTLTADSFLLQDASDKNYSLAVYAAGTAYALTAVSAALDFGTTDPVLTLNKAGTYFITSRANLEYVGATFAANRTATLKLRRTNNTAADLTGSSTAVGTNVVTTASGVLAVVNLPGVIYTTALTNDSITIFGDVSVVPTAGALSATEASIVAVRLY